jgi:hypothetical protein
MFKPAKHRRPKSKNILFTMWKENSSTTNFESKEIYITQAIEIISLGCFVPTSRNSVVFAHPLCLHMVGCVNVCSMRARFLCACDDGDGYHTLPVFKYRLKYFFSLHSICLCVCASIVFTNNNKQCGHIVCSFVWLCALFVISNEQLTHVLACVAASTSKAKQTSWKLNW